MGTKSNELNLDIIWGQSWVQAKKHFLPIFLMNIIIYMCSKVLGGIFYSTAELTMILQKYVYSDAIDMLIEELKPVIITMLPMVALGSFIGWLAATYFKVALNRLLLDGVKELRLSISERIKGAWNGYLSFLGITLLNSIIIGIGYACCILPGIFLTVRLMFVPIIAANKPELTLSEVFSESWKLSRGHFWTLLGYGIVGILINITGLICCCVGIFFTYVITQFMRVNIYYTLVTTDNKEKEIPYGEAYDHD